ncbi:MAG: hypothetical protein J7L62_02255 [Candidatus Aminicenantes bacterium]|nr:hypothetical protein [Candidatus Aminicenantes bacterium]
MRLKNYIMLTVFSISFAYVESAVVVYLRSLAGKLMDIFPMPFLSPMISAIELGREASTILILIAIGYIAEKTPVRRFYAFLYVFGLWDILYYAWLKIFIGWPQSIFDFDLLFLIPLPWIGPVISPVLIALIFCFTGSLVLLKEGEEFHFKLIDGMMVIFGGLILILNFLLSSIEIVAISGVKGLESFQPHSFNWEIYLVGIILLFLGLFLPVLRFYKGLKVKQ